MERMYLCLLQLLHVSIAVSNTLNLNSVFTLDLIVRLILFKLFIHKYGCRNLEEDGVLHPDNEVDIYCLHICFMHLVQKDLDSFRCAWNEHKIRTAHNMSPKQLFIYGLHQSCRERSRIVTADRSLMLMSYFVIDRSLRPLMSLTE